MKKIALFFLLIAIAACSSESLSVKKATNLIESHTEKYPYFETTNFQLGEHKFNIRKDAAELSQLKSLAAQNLITLNTVKTTKKWLSKDSVSVVNIALTAEASPYVVEQKKNRAEVKSYLFTIQEDSDVQLELNNKTKATATAKLIKTATPFATAQTDSNPNAAFITKKFTLKYAKDTGWYVVK
ncbi:hypothetical protein [Paenimyroides aestuarii]|uniref:Lipoprotein n=1 Tax=Paenimyroides aestuarii TaxID=2968490 RepID=A0ABY5NUZ2_9FLAO|nr:hypothetical protein [Paenimyroides aestuarii]UUV22405.1 hypothetical protein NPX36_05035 [Paenimyroides aestuarii]